MLLIEMVGMMNGCGRFVGVVSVRIKLVMSMVCFNVLGGFYLEDLVSMVISVLSMKFIGWKV